MLTEVQDRDAIVSRALEIASPEERDAYIARACGDDAALRREVEEMITAHLQARNGPDKPAVVATPPASPERDLEQTGTHQAEQDEGQAQASSRSWKGARKYPRLVATAVVLLVLVTAVGSASVAVWAYQAVNEARTVAQQAAEERDHALKTEAELKQKVEEAEAARQAAAKEREEELAAERSAQRSAEDTKAVLAFLEDKVLSAGRPKGLSGGLGKDVTLRQAADAAESEVAKIFADRPLAEASIREALGSAYLDLEEPALAVKQFERALTLREAMLGPDHPDTTACRNKLAVAYHRAGRPNDASRLYDQNAVSPAHAAALAVQGSALLAQKKPVQAELKLRECLAIRQKVQPDDWTTFDAKSMLGEALLDQQKYADAEPMLLSGYKGLKQREAKIPAESRGHLTQALERLVRLYEARNEKNEAAPGGRGHWRRRRPRNRPEPPIPLHVLKRPRQRREPVSESLPSDSHSRLNRARVNARVAKWSLPSVLPRS